MKVLNNYRSVSILIWSSCIHLIQSLARVRLSVHVSLEITMNFTISVLNWRICSMSFTSSRTKMQSEVLTTRGRSVYARVCAACAAVSRSTKKNTSNSKSKIWKGPSMLNARSRRTLMQAKASWFLLTKISWRITNYLAKNTSISWLTTSCTRELSRGSRWSAGHSRKLTRNQISSGKTLQRIQSLPILKRWFFGWSCCCYRLP